MLNLVIAEVRRSPPGKVLVRKLKKVADVM
jgi:hypothetical protein